MYSFFVPNIFSKFLLAIRYRERIINAKVLGCSQKFFRYREIRYMESQIHGKTWGENRNRLFSFVIEKIRYIESRYRERRL